LYAVILAGGKGKRFWPYSRAGKPKQFLNITGEGTMIALTFERIAEFIPPQQIFLLTVRDQYSLVHEELPELPVENIFVEPVGRNTAPSLAVAASLIRRRGEDMPVLCCPSDHIIRNPRAFQDLVMAAAEVAVQRDCLITFGITPDRAATGYGYIEAGSVVCEKEGQEFHEVRKFHEKPDREKAENYLMKGSFYWNSGIFLWRPSVYMKAWSTYLPEGREPLDRITASFGSESEAVTIEAEYPKMPSISVDYGILEKADNVLVAPALLDWNDVGSWDALFDILPKDDYGNVGSGGVELIDSKGNIFFNPGGVTAAVGVEDLILVVKGQTVLACKRGQSQRIRELVDYIEKRGKRDLLR
jgi:mannose-1-phosphate guanylyltransferase